MEQLTENRKYMESQFTNLNKSINHLISRMDSIEHNHADLEKAVTFCGEEIDDIKKQIKDIQLIKSEIEEIKRAQKAEVNEMQRNVEQLQSEKNLKTLRITGIPKTHNEDLGQVAVKLCESMSCTEITKNDIESIFRLKNKDSTASNTIVLRFSSMTKRDRFYNGRKVMAKKQVTTKTLGVTTRSESKIYINETLSRSTQTLFYNARKRKAELGYQYIWTYHAAVYMRKSSEDDMVKISNQSSLDNLS